MVNDVLRASPNKKKKGIRISRHTKFNKEFVKFIHKSRKDRTFGKENWQKVQKRERARSCSHGPHDPRRLLVWGMRYEHVYPQQTKLASLVLVGMDFKGI